MRAIEEGDDNRPMATMPSDACSINEFVSRRGRPNPLTAREKITMKSFSDQSFHIASSSSEGFGSASFDSKTLLDTSFHESISSSVDGEPICSAIHVSAAYQRNHSVNIACPAPPLNA